VEYFRELTSILFHGAGKLLLAPPETLWISGDHARLPDGIEVDASIHSYSTG